MIKLKGTRGWNSLLNMGLLALFVVLGMVSGAGAHPADPNASLSKYSLYASDSVWTHDEVQTPIGDSNGGWSGSGKDWRVKWLSANPTVANGPLFVNGALDYSISTSAALVIFNKDVKANNYLGSLATFNGAKQTGTIVQPTFPTYSVQPGTESCEFSGSTWSCTGSSGGGIMLPPGKYKTIRVKSGFAQFRDSIYEVDTLDNTGNGHISVVKTLGTFTRILVKSALILNAYETQNYPIAGDISAFGSECGITLPNENQFGSVLLFYEGLKSVHMINKSRYDLTLIAPNAFVTTETEDTLNGQILAKRLSLHTKFNGKLGKFKPFDTKTISFVFGNAGLFKEDAYGASKNDVTSSINKVPVEITMSEALAEDVQITYALRDTTGFSGVLGSDLWLADGLGNCSYTSKSSDTTGVVNFLAGQTKATVNFCFNDDIIDEPNGTPSVEGDDIEKINFIFKSADKPDLVVFSNSGVYTLKSQDDEELNRSPVVTGSLAKIVLNEDFTDIDISHLSFLDTLNFNDPDGDPLTVSVVLKNAKSPDSLKSSFNKSVVSGKISGPLTLGSVKDQYGIDTAIVTVSDNKGATNVSKFAIEVLSVNDIPIITGKTLTLNESQSDSTIKFNLYQYLDTSALNWRGAANEQMQKIKSVILKSATARTIKTTVTVDADTSLNWTLTKFKNGLDTIRVVVRDDSGTVRGGVDSVQVVIPVVVTAQPSVVQINGSINFADRNEDFAGTISVDTVGLQVVDPDNRVLTTNVRSKLGLVNASFNATSQKIELSKVADANGLDSIIVEIKEGATLLASKTFGQLILSVNDAPVISAKSLAYNEPQSGDSVIKVKLFDYLDTSAVNWRGAANEQMQKIKSVGLVSASSHAIKLTSIVPADTSLNFTLQQFKNGLDTIRVVVRDDSGTVRSGVDSVVVLIPLTIIDQASGVTINGSINFTDRLEDFAGTVSVDTTGLQVVDPDNRVLTLNVRSKLGLVNASFNSTSHKIELSKVADANGLDSIIVEVKLGASIVAMKSFAQNILSVNDAPVFALVADTLKSKEDVAIDTLFALGLSTGPSNENTQILRFKLDSNSHLSLFAQLPYLDSVSGKLRFTPAKDSVGIARILVQLRDNGDTLRQGVDSTAWKTLYVQIQNVNDAPVVSDANYTIREDSVLNVLAPGLLANASDVDRDPLTTSLSDSTRNGVLTLNSNGSFVYVPNQNFFGADSFRITVSDGQVPVNAWVRITVTPVNDAPLDLLLSDSTVKENSAKGTLVGRLSTLDVDVPADQFTYSLVDLANYTDGNFFRISGDSLLVEISDSLNYERDSLLLIKVMTKDQVGDSLVKNFVIRLINVNDNPVRIAQIADQNLLEDFADTTIVDLSTIFKDEDGDALVYTVSANNSKLTSKVVGNQLVLQSQKDSVGLVQIIVVAKDPSGLSVADTLSVQIANINDNPILSDAKLSVQENSGLATVVGTLLGSDVDVGDQLSYQLVGSSDRYAIVGNQIQVKTTNLDYESRSVDTLKVVVLDKAGLADTAMIVVNLENVIEKSVLDIKKVIALDDAQQTWTAVQDTALGHVYLTKDQTGLKGVDTLWTNDSTLKITYLQDRVIVDSTLKIKSEILLNGYGLQEVVRIYHDPSKDFGDTLRFVVAFNSKGPLVSVDTNKHYLTDSIGQIYINDSLMKKNKGALDFLINEVGSDPFTRINLDTTIKAQLSEGSNTIYVVRTDRYGNTTIDTVRVILDTKAPLVVIRNPRGPSGQDTSTIYSLRTSVNWTVDDREQTTQTSEVLQMGANTIVRKSCDFAGNCGADTVWVDAVLEDNRIAVEVENNFISKTDESKELDYFSKKNEGRKNSGSVIPEKEGYNVSLSIGDSTSSQYGMLEELGYYDGTEHHQIKSDDRVAMDPSDVLGARVKISMQFPVLNDDKAKCGDGSPMWKLHVNGISVNIYDQIGQFVSSVRVPAFDIDKPEYQHNDGKIEAYLELPKVKNDMRAIDGRRWGDGVYLLNVRVRTTAQGVNCNSTAVNPANYSTLAKIGYMRDR